MRSAWPLPPAPPPGLALGTPRRHTPEELGFLFSAFFPFFFFFLKHWHFLVTAGFEGMVAADWWQLIVGILVSVVVLLAGVV